MNKDELDMQRGHGQECINILLNFVLHIFDRKTRCSFSACFDVLSVTETGARNRRSFCAVNYNTSPGFEIIHGLLDRLMQLLQVPYGKEGYHLVATNGESPKVSPSLFRGVFSFVIYSVSSVFHVSSVFSDPSYFPGRCAAIHLKRQPIGRIGVLHPEVISKFELNMPCAAVEVDIENFV